MAKAVFCIARTEQQARDIVLALKDAGFPGSEISVLFPDRDGTRDFAHEQHSKAPEGAATGAATGGTLGGVVGFLAGIGTLAIPGVGVLIAAGPIMAALSGAATGATVGGLTGALVGYGIPEYEAKRYEGKVTRGQHPDLGAYRRERRALGGARHLRALPSGRRRDGGRGEPAVCLSARWIGRPWADFLGPAGG